LRFGLSYRDIEALPSIPGVELGHTKIQRWEIKFLPMIEKNFRTKRNWWVIDGGWIKCMLNFKLNGDISAERWAKMETQQTSF